jgi:hypothetical protein
MVAMAKRSGLTGKKAVVYANKATRSMTGKDCLQILGLDYENERTELDVFIDEMVLISPEASVSPPVLFHTYKAWCANMEVKQLGKFEFYKKITSTLELKRRRPTNSPVEVFEGCGLKEGLALQEGAL